MQTRSRWKLYWPSWLLGLLMVAAVVGANIIPADRRPRGRAYDRLGWPVGVFLHKFVILPRPTKAKRAGFIQVRHYLEPAFPPLRTYLYFGLNLMAAVGSVLGPVLLTEAWFRRVRTRFSILTMLALTTLCAVYISIFYAIASYLDGWRGVAACINVVGLMSFATWLLIVRANGFLLRSKRSPTTSSATAS